MQLQAAVSRQSGPGLSVKAMNGTLCSLDRVRCNLNRRCPSFKTVKSSDAGISASLRPSHSR